MTRKTNHPQNACNKVNAGFSPLLAHRFAAAAQLAVKKKLLWLKLGRRSIYCITTKKTY
jgi:hypothetical protein